MPNASLMENVGLAQINRVYAHVTERPQARGHAIGGSRSRQGDEHGDQEDSRSHRNK